MIDQSRLAIYDNRYFRTNKLLLRCVGLWPYDRRAKILETGILLMVIVFSIPNIIGLAIHIHDTDLFMEHLYFILVMIAYFMKIFTIGIAEKKMKLVYSCIADNWDMITEEDERGILRKHSERGRLITITYARYLLATFATFVTLPALPALLDVISPLPQPRPRVYIFKSEFLIEDKDAHYTAIYVWDVLTGVLVTVGLIACDSTYSVIVEQCLALYSIVKHRLLKLKKMVPANSRYTRDDSYNWLVETIKLNQLALRFTQSIEDTYSVCFFALAIENIIVIPLLCVLVVVYMYDEPLTSLRFATFFFGLLVHLFMIFWPGQKIIDHSTSLMEDSYGNEWYESAAGTKKLLRFFMLKCMQPSLLSAGGLILLNFENYLSIVKTALSYMTVILSFR